MGGLKVNYKKEGFVVGGIFLTRVNKYRISRLTYYFFLIFEIFTQLRIRFYKGISKITQHGKWA